ncbi:MAG: hypothetical protein E7564_05085 [Ruminococcaceae bacterium]|nr:hypothetical protein [Oscillospiraceae bacterium]
MSTFVYNYKSNDVMTPVGHCDADGVIYNHPYSDIPDFAIGHIDSKGIIYNKPYTNYYDYAVGHVDSKGVIYKEPSLEFSEYAIGHISFEENYIYKSPYSEYDMFIGKYEGNPIHAAAVAFLLMRSYFSDVNPDSLGRANGSSNIYSKWAAEVWTDAYVARKKFERKMQEKHQNRKEQKSDKPIEQDGKLFRWYKCPACSEDLKIEFSEGLWKTECTNCDSELKIKMAMNKADEGITVLTNRYKKAPEYLYYKCPDCGKIDKQSFEEGTFEADCSCGATYRFKMDLKCRNTREYKADNILKKSFTCRSCKTVNTVYFHSTKPYYSAFCKKCRTGESILLEDYEVGSRKNDFPILSDMLLPLTSKINYQENQANYSNLSAPEYKAEDNLKSYTCPKCSFTFKMKDTNNKLDSTFVNCPNCNEELLVFRSWYVHIPTVYLKSESIKESNDFLYYICGECGNLTYAIRRSAKLCGGVLSTVCHKCRARHNFGKLDNSENFNNTSIAKAKFSFPKKKIICKNCNNEITYTSIRHYHRTINCDRCGESIEVD